MSTTATLEQSQVRLDAGGEAVVPLHIRNNGQLVEGYRIEVVGVPADWTVVEPPEISLYPGDSTTATIAFHPPRTSALPAGELPFGVRVVPTEHPRDAVVPEGVVELLPFLDTTAELVPRTSHGRRGARHQVAVDNRGNVPVQALLAATDPTNALHLEVVPEALTVNPGNAAFVDVRVRSVKRIWRGMPKTHPFGVIVTPHGDQAVTLDGAHVQDPVFPKWLLKALIALLALLALLAALWFLVLKPAVNSAAKDAVREPLAKASSQAAAAKQAAAAAAQQAAQAKQQASAVAKGSPVVVPPAKPAVASVPFSQRLEVFTAPGATNSTTYTVPTKQTLRLTDLIFENPNGDFGNVVVQQDGTTLMKMALENFREPDYHFVSPIVVTGGGQLTMTVTCHAVGRPPSAPVPSQCDTAVFLGGTTLKPAS